MSDIVMGMENENMVAEKETPKKSPFAIWTVGGKDYQLKLRAKDICKVEQKLGKNLLTVIGDEDDYIPPLSTMLTIVQASMGMMNHGITFENVQDLFDKWCEEGGSQMDLLIKVISPLLEVSGFFTKEVAETMKEELMGATSIL